MQQKSPRSMRGLFAKPHSSYRCGIVSLVPVVVLGVGGGVVVLVVEF
jgi:hypothetical protein